MYKSVAFYGALNERTGYGVHASRFTEALSKLIPVNVNGQGEVNISMVDSVSIQNINERLPYPSIIYNVWESTEQPQWFMERLKYFDQLWVASEWQRAASIAQGVPEEFVKVVPEGVDPEIYKPDHRCDTEEFWGSGTFNFLHIGQWQPRKSTQEIVAAFLKAFPDNQNVRLYLSTDTLFPSDSYNSTEERLAAYGLQDPRIIPVHFEEREAYIRRLQSAHCFVSCARSEGWGLPIIEAMACGIPTIVADWSGSTEYATDALNVRISKLIKPFGIYGNWEVPGQWCEPDYDHLVEVMRDAYNNYTTHKEKALLTSTTIRTKFSWDAAAKKAYDIIQSIPEPNKVEIDTVNRRNAIFTVDCHPTSQDKMDTLMETIAQIKELGYPVLITSHVALPQVIIEMADYYIYDKRDILSGDDKPIYWRIKGDGTREETQASISCHALAALHNVRNAVDFCLGKYDWIYQMTSDTEIDLPEWLNRVNASTKDLIAIRWENQPNTLSGQITAARTEVMDKITPRIATWDEFTKIYGEDRFCSERGYYKLAVRKVGLDGIDWITMDVGNRFNQVDLDAWKDEEFQCHFVEGPFLNIVGMSRREYEVTYSNPIDGTIYSLMQKPGMWSRPAKKYYRDWTVTAKLNGEIKFQHHLDLANKNVIISFGSKALGDTIAWMPYIEEFRKKHNCTVYCSSWWNHIFDYPEIKFVKPGEAVEDVYASYDIGCFDDQLDRNVKNWRTTPLQQVASDILGLDYEPIRAKLKYTPYKPKTNGNPPKPYICFSEFSTMQNKLWNREGAWQKVIDHLIALGYDCISVSVEATNMQGAIKHNGQPIEQTLTDVSGAEFYIGLNAGPTWIATALGIPVIMITGVSEEWNDFPNPHRISVDVGCKPCFNDLNVKIDRGWDWCYNKDNKFACTKEITEEMVIEHIEQIRKEKGHAATEGEIRCSSQSEYLRDGEGRPSPETGDCRSHEECRQEA